MKKFLFLLLLLPSVIFAQKLVKHTVVAKESYSSIGRLYNINGRELAEYNNLDYSVGLSIGQVLKVPVKSGAVVPSATVTTPVVKTNQPIYHTLTQGESLYQLSRKYAPSTVDEIRKWNNLSSDNLVLGQRLIVGYGKEKANQEVAVKDEEVNVSVFDAKEADPEKEKVADTKSDAKKLAAERKKLEEQAAKIRKQEEELEAKRLAQEKKQEEKKIEEDAKPDRKVSKSEGAGYFKKDFSGMVSNSTIGKAGVFKSTSGWEDEKYYALFDDARSGSILKITNKETGKVVYVKVLDIIPKLNENKNVKIRLSNAAAAALGADESEFDCSIDY